MQQDDQTVAHVEHSSEDWADEACSEGGAQFFAYMGSWLDDAQATHDGVLEIPSADDPDYMLDELPVRSEARLYLPYEFSSADLYVLLQYCPRYSTDHGLISEQTANVDDRLYDHSTADDSDIANASSTAYSMADHEVPTDDNEGSDAEDVEKEGQSDGSDAEDVQKDG